MYSATGKNADPDFRRERAQIARRAQIDADSYVRRLAAEAPELTDAQKARLVVLLFAPGRSEGGAA